MHVVFVFPHKKSVHNFVCGVCVDCRLHCYQPRSRFGSYLHIFIVLDGWSFHDFLANATMNTYLNVVTTSLVVLFVSASFMNSVKTSVIYSSCSSLGMHPRNGFIASKEPGIKKHKCISKRISYHIAWFITVPGQSSVASCVTQWYSVCFSAEHSVVNSHPINFI